MIQPHEYDELPELTDEMVARSVFKAIGPPDWPADFDRSERRDVVVELDPEIAARLTATGEALKTRVDLILRDWLDKQTT